jgi:hypothetical protein
MATTVEQIRRILELPADPKARISRADREMLYIAALCDRGLEMQRELRQERARDRKKRARIKSTLRPRTLHEKRFDEKFERLIKMLSRRSSKGHR